MLENGGFSLSSYFVTFSYYFLFVVLALSSTHKLFHLNESVSPVNVNSNLVSESLKKLTSNHYFYLVEFAFAITFILFQNTIVSFLSALILFAISISGIAIKYESGEDCNCFGKLISKNSGLYGFTIFGIIISSIVIAVSYLYEVMAYSNIHMLVLISSVLFVSISRDVFFNLASTKPHQDERVKESIKEIEVSVGVSKSINVGLFQGRDILLGDLVKLNRITLIVHVSKKCQSCLDIISDSICFAKVFKEGVSIVIISDTCLESSEVNAGDNVVFVVDENKNYLSNFNPKGMPFAYLLDYECEKTLGPIAYGKNKIRFLFSFVLGLRDKG